MVLRRAALARALLHGGVEAPAGGPGRRTASPVSRPSAWCSPPGARSMLGFALAQVRQQRRRRTVLGTGPGRRTGFAPALAVQSGVGARIAWRWRPQPRSTLFGDVLATRGRRPGATWCSRWTTTTGTGPDFVADLLAGPRLLAAPSWSVLPPSSTTWRRSTSPSGAGTRPSSTRFRRGRHHAGRPRLLREVGGFRSVRKYVDAQLLRASISAGAATYRTQASATCCAATPPATPGRSTWTTCSTPAGRRAAPGFAPSRLLAYDDSELPDARRAVAAAQAAGGPAGGAPGAEVEGVAAVENACGARRLRPSRSTSRNSGHSVRCSTRSASRQASTGVVGVVSGSGTPPGRVSLAWGSWTVTCAPRRWSWPAM